MDFEGYSFSWGEERRIKTSTVAYHDYECKCINLV